ncbi:hypothetical protein ABZS84_08615 [Streptomyces sp. NPDC005481]|jgi:hypothetical protein|uniref:hypothetical protein n=1 Tax=Streptomyces sp. NPDC005481 TaxID=3154881 RepID=UPI0033AE9C93
MTDPYARSAPDEKTPGPEDGRRRRWWLIAAVPVLAGAVIAAGVLVTGADDGKDGGRAAREAADARWAEGITPEWMAERMGLDVPATAGSPRAAYEVTSRFDTGLLTFTLTRAEAKRYLEKHPPDGKWLEPTSAQTTNAHDFAHFGLPEPETLKKGVRYGYVCPGATAESAQSPPDTYDTSDERCVRLYAHDYTPTRARIYLRTHFDPGISPLPPTPSP